MKCPICDIECREQDDHGDMRCPECQRDWYVDAEGLVFSRTRRVRLTKLPEAGDKLSDVIEPEGSER